jgi:hypothetical protein
MEKICGLGFEPSIEFVVCDVELPRDMNFDEPSSNAVKSY